MDQGKHCPVCGRFTGFYSTRCLECGYDHSKHEFEWIKIDVKYLKAITPDSVVKKLINMHREKYVKRR